MPCYQWLMRLHDLSQWVAATADEARFCRETPIDGLYRSWLTPNRSHQRAIAALLRILYPRYSKNPGHGCGMSGRREKSHIPSDYVVTPCVSHQRLIFQDVLL